MAYYPTKKNVERHMSLLRSIDSAIQAGNEIKVSPASDQSPGGAGYWIRNLLHSAEYFPEFGFDHLKAMVSISIENDGKIRIYPTGSPTAKAPSIERLDELGVLSEIAGGIPKPFTIVFEPSDEYSESVLLETAEDFGFKLMLDALPDGSIRATGKPKEVETKSESREAINPFDLI